MGWKRSAAGHSPRRLGFIGGFALGAVGIEIQSYNDVAKKILMMLSCEVARMHEDIAADPPDPAFATVQPPVFSTLTPSGDVATDALMEALDRQAAYGIATRIAYERYQGAQAAGDATAQQRQLDATGEFGLLLADAMRTSAAALRAAAATTEPAVEGVPVSTPEALADLHRIAERVTTDGFTAAETAQLRALGATDAQIVNARTWFGRAFDITPGATLDSMLNEVADGFDAAVGATDAFARHVSAVEVLGANQSPTASFTVNRTIGVAPLAVAFDGAASTDPEGTALTYSWDFGDGATESGVTASHVYSVPGTYTATLTVTDADGATAEASEEITVTPGDPDNEPPTAMASATPTSGDAPLDVAFDTAGSSDADGTISSFEWSFGDGGSGSGATTTHTYSAPGAYTATVTVTDDGGASATASVPIVVTSGGGGGPNEAPIARFTFAPVAGLVPLAVQVDGSSSTDDTGITSFAWHFSDGVTVNGPVATHTFTSPGNHTIDLTVTDSEGATHSTSAALYVQSANTIAAPFCGDAGDPVDPVEPRCPSYTLSPDVQFLTVEGTQSTDVTIDLVHKDVAGQQLSSFTVDDDLGRIDGVAPGDPTYAALAVARAEELFGTGDTPVNDATLRVPGGTRLAFYTSGLSNAELSSLDDPRSEMRFSLAAANTDRTPYMLTYNRADGPTELTFEAEGGYGSDFDDLAVTITAVVTAPEGPPVALAGDDRSVDEGGSITADASASYDPDGAIVAYEWQFGDGTPSSAERTVDHMFGKPGTHDVTLTVTDDDGNTATDTFTVVVKNVAPYGFAPTPWRVSPGVARPYQISAYNPGPLEPLHAVVDFGDGTDPVQLSETGSIAVGVPHTYASPGVYRITISVTDESGSTWTNQDTTITVADLAADAGPDAEIDEGSSARLGGPGTSPVDPYVFLSIDPGDGGPEMLESGLHLYRDDGTYTATLTVRDDGPEIATDTATISVRNVAPSVSIAVGADTTSGSPVSLRGFGRDPGGDELTYAWDFGDGTTASGSTLVHTFRDPGTYQVRLTVQDEDGASTTVVRSVEISAEPAEAAVTSSGRDFWVMFPRNYAEPTLTLFISGAAASTGRVEIPGLGFDQPFSVTPGEVTAVPLPSDAGMAEDATVTPTGIHLTADADVTVYGLNRVPFTTDAYLGLPTRALGTSYLVLAYPETLGAQASIVATENDTTVTLAPTPGNPGFETVELELDLGDTYTLHRISDLTGVEVTSSRPVAVFGGNQCANIPIGVGYCDHIVEQLPPTRAWGQAFLTMPLAGRTGGDTFRFLAAEDDTVVTVNGATVATLDRGEVHEQLIDGPARIEGTGPLLVAQFSNGSGFDGTISDPFMALTPPYEQFLSAYTVSTPASGFRTNVVNVVAPEAAVGEVRLDGEAIAADLFTPIGETGFAGAQVPVGLGTHNLDSSSPFGVTVYGFDADDSYGYPGGFGQAAIAAVTELTASPASQQAPVGGQACITVAASTGDGDGVVGARIDVDVTGAHPGEQFGFTTADGTVVFCLDGETEGEDVVTFRLGSLSDTARIDWVGAPPNGAPVAADDTASTPEDTPVDVAVLANDSDDGPLEVTAVTEPTMGAAQILAGGTIRYTPDANATGTDTFTYTIRDATGLTTTATVTVVVTPVNDPPTVGLPVTAATVEGSALTLAAVTADPDGDSVTIEWSVEGDAGNDAGAACEITGTTTGTIACNDDGGYTVTAEVTDASGASAAATTRVQVTNAAPSVVITAPPTGSTVSVGAAMSAAATVGDAGGNDTAACSIDWGDGSSSPGLLTAGTCSANHTYTAAGIWTVTVTATDDDNASGTSSVQVTSVVQNRAPEAADDGASTAEDTPAEIPVLANDSDPDGDALTVTTAAPTAFHGTVACTATGACTYTPAAGFSGADSFGYGVSDGHGGTATATVRVTVTAAPNGQPTAVDDSLTTPEDTVGSVDVLANDSDPDGDTLTVTSSAPVAAHGSVACTAAGRCTYTPAPDYSGPDGFDYTVADGRGGTATAHVTVTVTPVNDVPVAVADSLTTPEDTAGSVDVLANDTDPDGDTLSVASAAPTAVHGSVACTAAGTCTYTPAPGYSGPDGFDYTVDDGHGDTTTRHVTVTVTPVNDPPVAVDDSLTTPEDTAGSVDVLANDSDPDGDTLTVTSAAPVAVHGSVACTAAGRCTYTPAPGYSGPDGFDYTVGDGRGGTATGHVTVTVTPVNDVPVAVDDSLTTPEDTAGSVDVLADDSDPDGDAVTVTSASPAATHGSVACTPAGTCTYAPVPDYSGPDGFDYTVGDGHGGTATGHVTVTVTPVDDAPVALPQDVTTGQDTPVGITLAGTDVDADPLTFAVTGAPAHGTLSGTGASLTYTPEPGYSGPDSFTFVANDGTLGSAPATVAITVTAESPECPATTPALDVAVSADVHRVGTVRSPKFSTAGPGELILAFVEADGPTKPTQQVNSVTGGGLTWTLVARSNATWGTVEVWQAHATGKLSDASVAAKLAKTGYDASITVAAFTGAGTQVGASATAGATRGAPSVTLTPTGCNSLVWAGGHDWTNDAIPVPGEGQTIVHKFIDTVVHDSFWVQAVTAPTEDGSPVTVSATGLVRDRWQLVAVEIPGANP